MDISSSIKEKLNEIEQVENVRVIMAVEAGSRAWGFASPDSDYDVRFIYARRLEDYLKLKPLRDVIEWQLDDVYDVSGWDLKKSLRLLYDANPTLHEWCGSPIVYMENDLAEPLRELTEEYFQPKKAMFHYLSMAKRNYDTHLTRDEVNLKKYFYALRPILAARWVEDFKAAPPMLFEALMDAELPTELVPIVEELLDVKVRTSELGTGSHIPDLDVFVTSQLEELMLVAECEQSQKYKWEKLDEYFRRAVMG